MDEVISTGRLHMSQQRRRGGEEGEELDELEDGVCSYWHMAVSFSPEFWGNVVDCTTE